MKIMYLTAEGFDTANPNNQLAMTMLDDFLLAGIDVYLVQSHRKGTYPDIPDVLSDREGFSSETILRPVVDKTNFVRRYADELRYLLKAKDRWKKQKDIDVVLLQSNPTSVFYLWFLKHIFKGPVIYSLFDIFPGSANNTGAIGNPLVYRMLKRLQNHAYRWSDAIVVPGEDMKDCLVSLGVQKEKISIIPNWYDDQSVKEILPSNNRFLMENRIDIKDKFIVQFAGTLGYVLDFDVIIATAKLLQSDENIEFHIIGDGTLKSRYYEQVNASNLKNVKLFPWQRIEIIQDVYSGCDICLLPLKDGVLQGGFPSKATLLMACHRVIVFSIDSNTALFRTVNEHQIGLAIPGKHPEQIAAAIRQLKDNPKQLEAIADNARAYAEKEYSRKLNTRKFIDLIYSVYRG